MAAALLREMDVSPVVCAGLSELVGRLDDEVWLVILTEESVHDADLSRLHGWLSEQASWSDLPVAIITDRPVGLERNPVADRLSEIFGNVTFLERPFHPSTFASVVRSAIRGRRRQYEAKARLEDLRESAEKLRTALTAGRLGSWEVDRATSTLTTSDDAKAHFGRVPDSPFTYRDLLSSLHPSDRGLLAAAVDHGLEPDQRLMAELRTVWPDGNHHWVEVSARHIPGLAGERGRLVGVSADVTDRKLAEQRLQDLNQTLEKRVAERTADLVRAHELVLAEIAERERAEEKLRQSQKMEMIGQLTGGVAHDFNNLLMAVLSNLDALAKRIPSDPAIARLLDTAVKAARRGAELTQRLLAFARQQDLNIRPVDLVALVHGLTEILKRSVGPQIDINYDLPGEETFASVDANQIELALLNLVVNARDAIPGGGEITIRVEEHRSNEPEGDAIDQLVCLTVEDTGSGMDAETLERAVEPYFTTKELGRGTGLGLSMVDGLAKQLKGALKLSSEPGVGTTATLQLPRARPDVASGVAVAEPRATSEQSPCKVLFVDDDFLVAMSTVDMLEELGHEVIQANSGEKALEILQGPEDIDLLITDHAMTGMTGMQLAEAALAHRPGLPVLLATGYAELPEGATLELPRLSKPYTQDDLAVMIAQLVPRHDTEVVL